MTDSTEAPPQTKFKVNDWVHYNDILYKIIIIAKNYYGWQYVIKHDSFSQQIKISDGDKYFRKA